jgi:Skp family chaperone for outer membrane proteins
LTVKPLEEHDQKKWQRYQKDIQTLVGEFEEWAKHLQGKLLAEMPEAQREQMMHRLSDDGAYLISLDIEKLLGKK